VVTELCIRDATLKDLPVLVRFNAALAWDTEQRRLSPQTLSAGITRALAAPELCRYYVAEVDGKVIGQTMVTFEVTDWEDGLVHWIQSVFVDPEHRGRGVFRQLYQHVVNTATAAGDGRRVRLYVEKDNDTAIATYKRLGMHQAHFHIYETKL
jgi:ribosomal protein S18 acetylase RimI-like enzyme